jgi:hypothetical protein
MGQPRSGHRTIREGKRGRHVETKRCSRIDLICRRKLATHYATIPGLNVLPATSACRPVDGSAKRTRAADKI